MKEANHSDKKDILIAALEERYEAMRVIRERVQSIGIWSLGLMLAAAGWLIQSDSFVSPERKLLYLFGVGAAFIALRFKYLDDLERGFEGQQKIAVRLERALGLYTPGVFS